jgi:hypothetical protein
MGAIGMVGTLAATGLQMYGQHQAAKAQTEAAKYNNQLAEDEARNREVETSAGIQRQRVQNRAALASLRNRAAFSGVQTTSGTPLILQGEAAGRFEMGIQDAARTAAMQAASLRAQGRMGLWEAAQASSASKINIAATGISGAADAFGQYRSGKYQGVFK